MTVSVVEPCDLEPLLTQKAREPPRQLCQSTGDLPLASDIWLLYLWSLHCACMERKENLQSQTGLSGIFSEIALNDKGGESLERRNPILIRKGQCLLEQSGFTTSFIDYMLLKMY